MSLITSCPACGTLFRVVPDQLKISDGWVRCGQCSEVFDASERLQTMADPGPAASPTAAPPEPSPSLPSPPPPSVEAQSEPTSSDVDMLLEDLAEQPPEPVLEPEPEAQAAAEAHAPFPTIDESLVDTPAPAEPEPVPEAQGPVEDVSFLRQARRRAFWSRRSVRAALSVAAVLLILLLAAQVAVHERDRLAALQPRWRPALVALCQPLRCRIAPPLNIEATAIESSSFSRLRPDAFRLSVALRNDAAYEVKTPSLELTLTDTSEQTVLRRVLAPAELAPAAPGVIRARGDWNASVVIGVTPEAEASRVAGYRLLAFYP